MLGIKLPIAVLFFLLWSNSVFADCQGCCSSHGGVVCRNGITMCGDGTSLSSTCRNKGCNTCSPEDIDDDGDGYSEREGDCNDRSASIYPGATEICSDGIDQDCNYVDLLCPEDIDDDGDGYTENQGDCDDSSPGIYPSANEICEDGIDQDCDGTDSICPVISPILSLLLKPQDTISCLICPEDIDDDGDGFTENQGDCDDKDSSICPGAVEICEDGIDQDCDGTDSICPVISSYLIVDIGILPGFVGSRAYGINDNGIVVGYSYNGQTTQAFTWTPDLGMQTISSLSTTASKAYSINNQGQIVGKSNNKVFLWSEQNGLIDSGFWGEANAINELGQVTGNTSGLQAYLWDGVSTQQLGTLGQYSHAQGINNGGKIVGYSKVADGPGIDITHVFIWDEASGMQDLGTFGGSYSYASDINDNDIFVGASDHYDRSVRPFLSDGTGGFTSLGSLGGASFATSINNYNQVVGYSYVAGENNAFIWEDGLGMRNLNNLIPASSSWTLTSATGINNHGQIVGYGIYNGEVRAFLLNPSL